MEAFTWMLLGAVIGAVGSLVLERVYRRFVEEIPCVRIQPSCSYGVDGQSFNVAITNIGVSPLPPYDVALYHPLRGTVRFLTHTQVSDRFPQQVDVFSFMNPQLYHQFLASNKQQARLINPAFQADFQQGESWAMLLMSLTNARRDGLQKQSPMTDAEFAQWRLRLILRHSDDYVLFEDKRSGAAIAEIARDCLRSGGVSIRGDQMWRVHAHNSYRLRVKSWWLDFNRRIAKG